MEWLGPCVRSVRNPNRAVYLTFDDGPDPICTPAVLQVLAKHQARATFFLIAKKAAMQRELLVNIQNGGHAIGNHSLDHSYGYYFSKVPRLARWIRESESLLHGLCGAPTVGFRPPAGVRTPKLRRALQELGLPTVLWSVRHYDSVWKWRMSSADHSVQRLREGEVILLHDRQRRRNAPQFLATLDHFLSGATRAGFHFEALTRQICLDSQT